MNAWFGKSAFLVGLVIFIAIRAPHDDRRKQSRVASSRKGLLEDCLFVAMTIGVIILPLSYVLTPLLAFADYPLHPLALCAGIVWLAPTFWLFHRSHVDLGKNWSPTLALREDHRLVDWGVYRRIRHPMYTSIFSYSIAQILLLPNWIAGPACLVAFALMFTCRIRAEERMMIDKFGSAYETYRQRTKRLIPWVW